MYVLDQVVYIVCILCVYVLVLVSGCHGDGEAESHHRMRVAL